MSALMLLFRPRHLFSWQFEVEQTKQGFVEAVARLRVSLFRERGGIEMNGRSMEIRRQSLLPATYVVTEGEREVLTVHRPNLFRRRYTFERQENRWSLEPVSMFRRAFELRLNQRTVGRIAPDSAFRRTGSADFPPDVPLELQLICLWLALLAWKRAGDAAAAGS